MKNILWPLIVVLIITFSFSCTPKQAALNENAYADKLRIDHIYRRKNLYVITAYRNDSLFTIISPKEKKCISKKKIRRYKHQHLKLKRLFPRENSVAIAGTIYVNWDGVKIKVNEKNHWSIYAASNLNGLCLIE